VELGTERKVNAINVFKLHRQQVEEGREIEGKRKKVVFDVIIGNELVDWFN
jgi:hypothetical protein